MKTHFAAVAVLFAAVGMTMLLAVLAIVSLILGNHALGFELGLLAVAVAVGTRVVTERAERSLVRA